MTDICNTRLIPFFPRLGEVAQQSTCDLGVVWGFFKVGHNNAIFISALCVWNESLLRDHAEIQGELPPFSWPADLLFYRIQLAVFPTEGASPFSQIPSVCSHCTVSVWKLTQLCLCEPKSMPLVLQCPKKNHLEATYKACGRERDATTGHTGCVKIKASMRNPSAGCIWRDELVLLAVL